MKGKLIYDQGEWWVQHMATSPDGVEYFQADTMLHPDDVKFLEDCNLVFDNLEARININPEVEFKMVTEVVASVGNSEEQDEYTIRYAKLIPSKEQQKQLITEIMDLDAKDGLYEHIGDVNKMIEISDEEIEKAAQETYPVKKVRTSFDLEQISKQIGFVSGIMWYREQLKQRQ